MTLLSEGDITVDMSDYGDFEKVGSLGSTLPTNDESITTSPGDAILYQGNMITIYYGANTWNLTKLGKIQDVTRNDLLESFGTAEVSVIFSLVE